MSALDTQEGGSHYKNMAIQPVEYIVKNNLGYLEGNVIKYVSRHRVKNGEEDIRKAIHYLQMILEMYSEAPRTTTYEDLIKEAAKATKAEDKLRSVNGYHTLHMNCKGLGDLND